MQSQARSELHGARHLPVTFTFDSNPACEMQNSRARVEFGIESQLEMMPSSMRRLIPSFVQNQAVL